MGLPTDASQPAVCCWTKFLFQFHLSYACDNNTAAAAID